MTTIFRRGKEMVANAAVIISIDGTTSVLVDSLLDPSVQSVWFLVKWIPRINLRLSEDHCHGRKKNT